ncbi:MAG: GatB/YqeY domain-containing protein [Crocinitomicaceae bacterium]|tara:strand:+ start:5386 stop:5838 length:453 start_codon:yes stop_codon:yes gene_type:complete
MTFTDTINQAIKAAMLAKDKVRLSTLRDVKSKIMMAATSGAGNDVGDDVVLKICMKLYKQRKETYTLYIEQGREDLAKDELEEANIIEEFLPKMLTEDEVRNEVLQVITSVQAQGPQDIGKCMGMLTQKLAGKADGKVISTLVREELLKL